MKVGDLVEYSADNAAWLADLGVGLVTGFDEEGDPIVLFPHDPDPQHAHGSGFFADHVRVICARKPTP